MMRLRQIALVASELRGVERDICDQLGWVACPTWLLDDRELVVDLRLHGIKHLSHTEPAAVATRRCRGLKWFPV